MSVRVLTGDALAVLPTLDAGSVQTCVTSPPYWGLRDYGVAGQLGLERTPDEYVERMVAVFREVRRVLRDDGTLWLNLGDSYARTQETNVPQTKNRPVSFPVHCKAGSSDGAVGRGDRPGTRATANGLKPKDLVGIPWRVAFALQADGWYLRSDIIWSKPNPMPESVTDRPTKAHEYLFLLTKRATYHYDADAIAEPTTVDYGTADAYRARIGSSSGYHDGNSDPKGGGFRGAGGFQAKGMTNPPTTRNARSVWSVATQPYSGAHFATFPPKLIEPCILAGTSPQACEQCGAPWRRVVESTPNGGWTAKYAVEAKETGVLSGVRGRRADGADNPATRTMLGWAPSCGCEGATGSARCVVLDPFGGAGTTGLVADRLGRDAVLIELNPEYAAMARDRITNDSPLFADVNGDAA